MKPLTKRERLTVGMAIVKRCREEGERAAREEGKSAKCPYSLRDDPLEHAGWMDGWIHTLAGQPRAK